MIARGRNKLTIRTTGDRILMQQEAEEQARVTLAKECQSITTVEHGMTLEEYNEAIEKFRTACEREKDKFYITPAEYGAILRYHRKNAGLSPMELSERTRIPAVVIEGYENGRVYADSHNRKILEQELRFPSKMRMVIVDEAHNNLYGCRNYAPVVQDACFAGRENARVVLQELRMLSALTWTVALSALLTAVFALLHLLPGMPSAKYIAVGLASLCAAAAFVLLILLRSVIKRQVRVKRAFFNVTAAVWGTLEPTNEEK